MRFAFTDDQLALAGAVRSLLADHFPPACLRRAWEATPGALDRDVWDQLSGMGSPIVLLPEAAGGLGLDWCSLVLVLEETGRVALPYPIVETAAVAAPLLGRIDAAELLVDRGTGRNRSAPMISCSLAGEPAACGLDADWLLVDHDETLWLLPRDAVRGSALTSVDRARRLLEIESVDLSQGFVLGEGREAMEAALDSACLGAAAQLLGLCQNMIDMTVGYVVERHQFGVPVGSFQAVKHRLVDALKELTFARPVVYRAAWSLATGDPESPVHVSMAKAIASDAAGVVAGAALQCHGALGYAFEYDLHMFMKRSWALQRSSGSAAWHRARVGAALGLS